jgi:replication-associated recombination protein RarA
LSRQARTTHQFSGLVLETLGDAEDVLDQLRILIDQYDVVRVADLYDLCDITSDFTDQKWGWYDLRSARIRSVRGGYSLDLPPTEAIV